MICEVHPTSEFESFVYRAQQGYDVFELIVRGRKIATAFKQILPDDIKQAVGLLLASLDPFLEHDKILVLCHLYLCRLQFMYLKMITCFVFRTS
jgi:hypothetical protein